MRIQRNQSHLFRRRSRRRSGCLPFLVLIGVVAGVVTLGRDWIGQWLNINHPQERQINLQNAQVAFSNGNLDSSIEFARESFASDPSNYRALLFLIRALIYRSYSDYDRAIDRQVALELSADGISQFPRNLDVLAIRAFALQANNQATEASRLALRVIEGNPDHVLARITLSLSYGSQGIFEAALREAQVAIELANQSDSWQMDSYRVLAIAYSDLGQYQAAIVNIQKAIEFNRKLIPLYFERALYALQIGDTDSASVAYYQIMAFQSENVKVRFRLCELSSTLREREAAVRYCSEVTQYAPAWSDGWYQLGREYFLQGNFASAQSAFNQCSSLQILQSVPIPDRRFECWYLQGQSAEILGDCVALVETYNEFLVMSSQAEIAQTWSYPPGGPPQCVTTSSPTLASESASP